MEKMLSKTLKGQKNKTNIFCMIKQKKFFARSKMKKTLICSDEKKFKPNEN